MFKKKFHFKQAKKELRINERIRAPRVRLISAEGSPEVVERSVALRRAQALGMDLVEVSPNQDPPVCRIINYGKYKFEQKKRKREQSRKQKHFTIKEIKLRPKIAMHDYDLKKRNAATFLEHGDKVKVSVRFRGREIAHPEIGMALMNRLAKELQELGGLLEVPAQQIGRQIHMVLAPQSGQHKPKVIQKKLAKKDEQKDSGARVSSGTSHRPLPA